MLLPVAAPGSKHPMPLSLRILALTELLLQERFPRSHSTLAQLQLILSASVFPAARITWPYSFPWSHLSIADNSSLCSNISHVLHFSFSGKNILKDREYQNSRVEKK